MFCISICNVVAPGTLEIKQFDDQVKIRLVLELISGISRVIQKLLDFLSATTIFVTAGRQLPFPCSEKMKGRGEGGQKKKGMVGGLKEFLPQIFAWRAFFFSCQNRLCKIKRNFKGSISNVGLGPDMGIGGGSRQCHRKCCPMWNLQQEKNYCHKVFFFYGL